MALLEPDLRVIVITDARLAHPRPVATVIREALEAGAPAVQLRAKDRSPRTLYEQALELRALTATFKALFFVNDRLDVALAARADGVHLGPGDLPVAAARRAAGPSFLIGWSTDDPTEARQAVASGANYIGCGAVFGTTSKQVGGERIGPERLRHVVEAVDVPVIGIGGVTPANVAEVARTGAAGAAVIHAVMTADDVAAAISLLLAPFRQ